MPALESLVPVPALESLRTCPTSISQRITPQRQCLRVSKDGGSLFQSRRMHQSQPWKHSKRSGGSQKGSDFGSLGALYSWCAISDIDTFSCLLVSLLCLCHPGSTTSHHTLLQMLSALCEATYPFLVSKALEAALQASQANTAAAGSVTLWQALSHPPAALVTVLVWMVISAVGETLFASLRAVCASLITVNTLKRLRSTVFAALLQQEKLWFQRRGYDAASLASRVTSDCEAVAKIVSINFNIALRQGVQSIGALGFLAYINPLIAAYCAISAILMSIMSLKYVTSILWYGIVLHLCVCLCFHCTHV